jgi:hypothetical protein
MTGKSTLLILPLLSQTPITTKTQFGVLGEASLVTQKQHKSLP